MIDAFRNHEYDILLGTQIVAKGLDFSDVTLVGVINADTSLNIPDFVVVKILIHYFHKLLVGVVEVKRLVKFIFKHLTQIIMLFLL